jgi:hypothetical protein
LEEVNFRPSKSESADDLFRPQTERRREGKDVLYRFDLSYWNADGDKIRRCPHAEIGRQMGSMKA